MAGPAVYLLQDSLGASHGVGGDSVRALIDSLTDSLGGAVGALRDTVTAAPLPGGVAEVVRFIFGVPQWIQISGAIVAAAVGIWLLLLMWRKREEIFTWLKTRSREIQVALAGSALLAVSAAGFAGMKSWNYMQHDNGFCTGCHVMAKPFGRFGEGAGKHEKLQCHDCHQQSIYASTRQLVLWVLERPEEIAKHAPVANLRCESCHVKGKAGKERWENVMALAGHRRHFESDSSALKDLKCVTCHGAEVHRFIPSARTCQQSGCHENKDIKLGKMADMPEVTCAVCHAFRREIPALATPDSAGLALSPTVLECTSCHEMLAKLPDYKVERDPHKGNCGSCHDVHADTLPQDAKASCVTCHDNLANSPFHIGPNHKRVESQCLTCHQPHSAKVDASDCVGCHREVQQRGKLRPPMPFDTMKVVRRRVSAAHTTGRTPSLTAPLSPHGTGDRASLKGGPPIGGD